MKRKSSLADDSLGNVGFIGSPRRLGRQHVALSTGPQSLANLSPLNAPTCPLPRWEAAYELNWKGSSEKVEADRYQKAGML